MSVEGTVILNLIGGGFCYVGWRYLQDARLLENLPTSKVRSIAMGLVELEGRIRTDKPLETPIGGEDCVYYSFSVLERQKDSKGKTRYVTRHKEVEKTRSVLQDNTGRVLVDLEGVDTKDVESNEIQSGTFSDPPKRIQTYLSKKGIEWEGFFGGNKALKYIEKYVPTDAHVTLIGTAVDNPYIKDGTSQRNAKDVMIAKDDNRFFISQGTEDEITKNDKLKGILLIVLGLLIIGIGLFLLF